MQHDIDAGNGDMKRLWAHLVLLIGLLHSAPAVIASDGPPSFTGYRGGFTQLRPTRSVPTTRIAALDGTTASIEDFRGRVVILNFWATWCEPCLAEMPNLDRLQASVDPERVAVVAVSIDQGPDDTIRAFASRLGLNHLWIYRDQPQQLGSLQGRGASGKGFALYALPITYVIDGRGTIAGYLPGPADWDSSAAKALIRYYTGQR